MPYKAHTKKELLIAPIKDGPTSYWEGHHATNPCTIRFKSDPRVFLGYRAGGTADYHRLGKFDVWSSHLGLAIIDEDGVSIKHRFPLPVMTIEHDIALPQNEEEYEAFRQSEHVDKILIMHDYRFTEYRDYLYVVFHEGSLSTCDDCVVRMPVKTFLEKIESSIQLSDKPIEEIKDAWRQLWWQDGVWEPCGINGSNRIFNTEKFEPVKGDILFIELEDGTLECNHRPLANGTAKVNTGNNFFVQTSSDGITEYGVFETNTRPGYLDNSHLGNNGHLSKALIGERPVYIDVTHGCGCDLSAEKPEDKHTMYYAYLRIKDRKTGELLYWSEDPVVDYDENLYDFAIKGEWVSKNPSIDGVMFTGGQEELIPGKISENDQWVSYVGLGDTTITTATFTLKELVPPEVLQDIANGPVDLDLSNQLDHYNCKLPEPVCGWDWEVSQNLAERKIEVVRRLSDTGETAIRPIYLRPGYFDAHGAIIYPNGVQFVDELQAWSVSYAGLRFENESVSLAPGIILLSGFNPEQVWYRSMKAFATPETMPVAELNAYLNQRENLPLETMLASIPDSVKTDLGYLIKGKPHDRPYLPMMEEFFKCKAQVAGQLNVLAS